uniref:Heparanase n=1 Tax=Melanaphis sacchari TaxID=742174 RepID=A0A2H8TMF1_9HEMI
MFNIVWFGALLLFGTCLTNAQNPSILVQPGGYPSNVLSININTKKCIHTVSDHFLSIALEPSTLFSALQKNLGSATINMAKSLNPAYIRISGPECNFFKFQGGEDISKLSQTHPVRQGRNNITITGWHWSQLNEFIAKTGLDLIVGLNVMNRQHGSWDLSNTLDLISYSDKHGYNMAFQIGNDIQMIGSRIDGLSLGKDANRLRKVLEAFPRYMNSLIMGPDVRSCETQEEARYLKNFIIESGPSLSAISYQVPFSSEKNIENPGEIFSYIQNQMEARVWQKDLTNKYLGKIATKKPLWIVESGTKDRKGDFMDGLVWAQRLCAGARVGINTIMRKPSLSSLSEPTADYWVSVLHKALVGPEVLDIKISSGNKTRLETVTHCTKMSPYDPNEGILAPEYRYNRGAVVVFGVNMGLETVKISLKTGQIQSLPLHQYFLTANNRQTKRALKSSSTMLNGQKLILSPDGDLPIISPKVRISNQLITIPSHCVFFLVLPDSKSKACTVVQIEELKDSYKNGVKVLDQEEIDETDYNTPVLDQEDESVSNEKQMYVAFRPKYIKTNDEFMVERREMSQQNNEGSPNIENLQQSEPLVKYVTFSNNNWLSKFPKTLNNREYSVESPTFSSTETTTVEIQTERSPPPPPQSRREKYHILAQAVAGKRYPDKNIRSDLYSNLDSALLSLKPSQKLKLVKRSADNTDFSSKELDAIIKEFTNKEILPVDPFLKTDHSSSEISIKSNEDRMKTHDRYKKEYTIINTELPEVKKSEFTSQTVQQTTITSTPPMSTAAVNKHHANHDSYVQKIKTRAEQALAKANEKNAQKIKGRRQHDKFKEEVKNLTVQDLLIEKPITKSTKLITEKLSMITSTQPITTNTEQLPSKENITNLIEKIRYNRQTNSTTTDGNIKIGRPRISLKSKKYINHLDLENAKTTPISSPITEITHFEPNTTEMPIKNTIKLRTFTSVPKTLNFAKPRVIDIAEIKNGKSIIRESRETTQQPSPKFKIKSVLHPLGKVKTPPNVDMDQIVTNEKITERLVENLRDGKKILQSEHIVSPVKKNEENKLESKTSLSAAVKIKALEEKLKNRRIEIEQKLQQKIHKVKRSPKNSIIEDDTEPALEHKIIRYPRSVADFTVKLNEVNTYVDKIKHTIDPKNNEVTEDSSMDWKNKNEMNILSEDSGLDNINIKLKRKSIFEDIDDDDYNKMTINMVNKLISHMQTFWKYLKKTFQF